MSVQDFKVEQDNYGQFDLVIDEENRIFDFVEGFETALYVQAFTDRRATNQDITNPYNRQGWIGNIPLRNEGFQMGSLVWLKRQSRDTITDKNEIKAFIESAYNRLISIGAIREVEVEIIGNTFEITIKNLNDEINRYSKLWRQTNATNT